MFTLKDYQQRALEWLERYLRLASELDDANTAFYQITEEIHGRRLAYNPVNVADLRELPYVCLRMPTGAGKTYVACHAVAVATQHLLEADRSVVVWLVPTNAILEQTLAALKDRDHPYRQALESTAGSVRVMDVEEALYLNRADTLTETIIIVSTIQSFRVEDTEVRKVYREDGSLMDHFTTPPKDALEELERYEDGEPIPSLANVLRLYRPIVIVDEAHNARTPLSFDTLARFRPSCILELTATPDTEHNPSNVLYSVSAAELKAEDMIKLPVELTANGRWQALLTGGINQRNELEAYAREEQEATGEYIRPIMLLQAEPNYSNRESLDVETVRRALIKDFRIPEEQIAVSTGSSDDLEGVDLASPECALRYVITVQKLKEGWDCPFAYVLCSVTQLKSTVAIEQIVGRILRMPRAVRKEHEALNRAYAFSASPNFAGALGAIKDVLVENGFERQEVDGLVRAAYTRHDGSSPPPLFDPPAQYVTAKITVVNEPPKLFGLPPSTQKKTSFDGETGTLTFRGEMTDEDCEALKGAYSSNAAKEAVEEARRRSLTQEHVSVRAASDEAEPLAVPVLLVRQGEVFEPFEKTHLMERPWKLSACDPSLPAFRLDGHAGERGLVDVDRKGNVQTRFVGRLQRHMRMLTDQGGWKTSDLVHWLDHSFPHDDIPQTETGIYLTKVVNRLISDRKFDNDRLVYHKYDLKKAVQARIEGHRQAARKEAYQTLIDADAAHLTVDPGRCFIFPEGYAPNRRYEEHHHFPKHLPPEVIGAMNDEEAECAQFLERLDEVDRWVRNLENRARHSFWLQTSKDKFYPDFVCRLKDGRILVVEYKGEHLWSNDDSTEKRTLGELWAARSDGRCLFVMPKGKDFEIIEALVN